MKRKTNIHVNQGHIARNAKGGTSLPVLTAKNYKENKKGQTAEIVHDGRVIATFRSQWAGDGQLSCGARVWVEVIEGDGVEVIVK